MPCLSVEQKPKNKPKKQNLRLTKKMQILFFVGVVALSLFVLASCGRDNEQITCSAAFFDSFFLVLTSWKKREWKSGLCFSSSDFEKKEPKQLLTFFIFAVLENELFLLLI
jgi:hypothetical protein